ncbi:hypothetical protein NDU88_001693 [Pleurodeles waltl]|uniref:Uncharacterized protein n=1 Tax=Pleurodeles waltl TaxID=8319 RepID=A0AAV7UVF3_PLEWA|nr:hypothetical protein NDU88_001693 [Pleurodeles waltl]
MSSLEQREQRTIRRKGEADRPATFWEERGPVSDLFCTGLIEEGVCDGAHWTDPAEEYPGGTVAAVTPTRKGGGAVAACVRTLDTQHLRVFKPEQEKVEGELFSPGGDEDGQRNRGRSAIAERRGGDEPSVT